MIPEFPTAFSPEQARALLSTLKLRARCPKLWSGAILYFSGADLHPGVGDDSRYAMMYIRKDRLDPSTIGAEWAVIDEDERSDRHHTFASIRYDARANAFDFLGARQTIQVPVNGSLGIRFHVVKPCVQHTLEEFA